MPLPSRADIQLRRTATEMLTLVCHHLQQDQPGAISDMDYFFRFDPIIKTIVHYQRPGEYTSVGHLRGYAGERLGSYGVPLRDPLPVRENVQQENLRKGHNE
jgi:hypothetical protein